MTLSMLRCLLCLGALGLGACAVSAGRAREKETGATSAAAGVPVVITRQDQLDAQVGRLVTIRGEVTNTKVATILGVDVDSFDPDLRGHRADATGILERHRVTQEEIDARVAASGQFAHRGPGIFYSLRDPTSGGSAKVRSISVTGANDSSAPDRCDPTPRVGSPCTGAGMCGEPGALHSYLQCANGKWQRITERPVPVGE